MNTFNIVTCLLWSTLLLFPGLFPCAVTFVNANEDWSEVGADGTSRVHTSGGSSKSRVSATFHNAFSNQSIYLFWLNADDGTSVFMNNIAPFGSLPLTTTTTHIFYATSDRGGTQRLSPRQIVVDADEDTYTFGPVGDGSGHVLPPSTSMPSRPLTKAGITKNPYVKLLNKPTSAVAAKFRSMVPSTIDIWFEDNKGGLFQGTLGLGKEYTINTYVGHVFFFTEKGDKSKEYGRFVMKAEQVLYMVRDAEREPPADMVQHQLNEENFMAEYYNRTGIQWRHYYGPKGPRAPPTLHMWPADEVGQIHTIVSDEGYWFCRGDKKTCKSDLPVELNMEVISTHPKAFVIPKFLSDYEADEIRRTADPIMSGSTVGNKDGGGTRKSDTRTSRNAWVGRDVNDITESLFARAEQLLKIPRLDRHNTEDMQVVHYKNSQRYDAHHDWGVSGFPESRFITLLLYLNDQASPNAGGETAFPKAAGGRGIKVHPGKGSAVLFYNLLEDGNGDDLSLHAALPTVEGEKWLANFWVWDPRRR